MKPGYYWINYKGYWQPAELTGWVNNEERWFTCGWEVPVDNEGIIEIGEELTHD